MGLDMYITKRTYIGANYDFNKITGTVNLKKDNERIPIKRSRVTYVIEELAYWRKAWSLHNWFVANIQDGEDDCSEYDFTLDKLDPLVEKLSELKARIPNGAGEYDTVHSQGEDWEVYTIRETLKIIKRLVKEVSNAKGFNSHNHVLTYHASW